VADVSGHTVILVGPIQRDMAKRLVDKAPDGYVVSVSAPTRTTDQNAKFWAMLSDVSMAKPRGRRHTPEVWKALFMNACGYPVQFEEGLSGEPFPIGFRSSRLSKKQMAELITFIQAFGDENGVRWSNEATFLDGQA
jgi:hypothetical protein